MIWGLNTIIALRTPLSYEILAIPKYTALASAETVVISSDCKYSLIEMESREYVQQEGSPNTTPLLVSHADKEPTIWSTRHTNSADFFYVNLFVHIELQKITMNNLYSLRPSITTLICELL
ncbi:hypothetical protein IC620_04335 [Hazenella sp. IB182357]|uniref:Uncharacterized protein n=1 Tax=Polycladospora coralii TaxID=2771432 RepID=A0A926N5A2_9BACL|nr:hypothetical protein [Polycladospora coralii]MBD1371584.1 hypothetical protein [Polycladospora coralii]